MKSKTQQPPSDKPVVRKNTCRQMFLVTALVSGLLCFVIAVPYLSIVSRSGEILLTQTAIQQNTLATIVPQSAYDIHYATISVFQSVHTHIRFTLLSSDLSDFIQGFCPTMEIKDGGYIPLQNVETLDWWKPEDAKIYSVGSCVESRIEIYKILIDKSNTHYFTVYVTQ